MKKVFLLGLLSLSLFAEVRINDKDSNIGRIEKLEQSDVQILNSFKQYDSFFDFQKDLNLENKKLLNECNVNLLDTKKTLMKVKDDSTYEEIGRLKSRISSLETTVNRQDDKIYKLEQRLNSIERKVK